MIGRNASKTLAMAIPFTVVAIYGAQPGLLEGKFFPVVGNHHSASETLNSDGDVDLTFEMDKLRDCKFLSLEFYTQADDKFWHYILASRPPRISAPVGSYFATWTLNVPKQWIGHPVKLVSHHQCWGEPLWATDTINVIIPENNTTSAVLP